MSYAKFIFFIKIEKFKYEMKYTTKNCHPPPNEKFQKDCIFSIYMEIFNFPNKNFLGKLNFHSPNFYNVKF